MTTGAPRLDGDLDCGVGPESIAVTSMMLRIPVPNGNKCRKVPSRFLANMLTQSPWREAVPRAGVRIKGARIVGDVDLANAKLIRPIEIIESRIEGAINLSHARTDSLILLDSSLMVGNFDAEGLHDESSLSLADGAAFKSVMRLTGAKIDGGVDMTGVSFYGALKASSLEVGGDLLMYSDDQNKASFKEVDLRLAKITGQVPWWPPVSTARWRPPRWRWVAICSWDLTARTRPASKM